MERGERKGRGLRKKEDSQYIMYRYKFLMMNAIIHINKMIKKYPMNKPHNFSSEVHVGLAEFSAEGFITKSQDFFQSRF